MDIPLYISELLDEQDYVVVPDLGAFLSSYRPAGFNDDRSLLLPPSRMISFYPEMKSNDGVLAGIIAQHQKIPLSQASRLLEKYTGELLVRIENGEKAEMGVLGYLSSEGGELRFTPGSASREFPESYGLSPVSSGEMVNTPDHTEPLNPEKKKKRIPGWALAGFFFLLIGIPIAVRLIFFPMHPDETSVGQVPVKDSMPEQATFTPGPSDSTDNQLPVVQSDGIQPDTATAIFIHPRKELFYTIGGSFRSLQNAQTYYGKMADKGFHPIHLGLIGNFYLVALDTFFTAKDAFEAADQYAPVHRTTEIWVYHQE